MSGLTLVETIVSFGLLGLMMTALLAVYQIGTSAWQKVEVRSDLLGQMHLVSTRLATACGRTPPAGVSLSPDGRAVAVCSPLLADGSFALNTELGTLTWQAWDLLWLDAGSGEIRYARLPLPVPSEQVTPLESEDDEWHLSPPENAAVLARHITRFEVAWQAEDPTLLEVRFEGAKDRYGRTDPETVQLRAMVKVGPP